MTDPIRVLVIEDHPIFSFGLTRAIEGREDLALAAVARTAEDAIQSVTGDDFVDVALVDVTLPDRDGVGLIPDLLAAGVRRVVMLSASTEGEIVHAALAAGAAGFVSKDADRAEICDAVVIVAKGESYLSPGLQAAVVDEIRRAADTGSARLSDRERQILRGIAEGLTYGEIGKRLFLATATVKTYASRAFEKLGVSDRSAAAAEAVRRGLIS
jgi:two-component system, NarL family, nitrate/nitrite response regulator NarL